MSGAVAKKEHDEFATNIDLIDVLPPGLYEAVMVPKDFTDTTADLIGGDYLVRFEARTFDDIRAMGGNDEEDDRKFATVARVSEINLGLTAGLFSLGFVPAPTKACPNGCGGCIPCAYSTRCSRRQILS